MTRWLKRNPLVVLGLGIVIGLLTAVAARMPASFSSTTVAQPQIIMPEFPLHASGAHGSDGFAMATGNIDENSDGLFTLDYLTGDLMCWVLNPKTGTFTALFTANVMADLGAEKGKKPNFAMATGLVSWPAGGGARPGNSVVYVADANTGKFVAYGVLFDPGAKAVGGLQKGPLQKITVGQGRNVPQR